MDFEKKTIERIRFASEMSLSYYKNRSSAHTPAVKIRILCWKCSFEAASLLKSTTATQRLTLHRLYTISGTDSRN